MMTAAAGSIVFGEKGRKAELTALMVEKSVFQSNFDSHRCHRNILSIPSAFLKPINHWRSSQGVDSRDGVIHPLRTSFTNKLIKWFERGENQYQAKDQQLPQKYCSESRSELSYVSHCQ